MADPGNLNIDVRDPAQVPRERRWPRRIAVTVLSLLGLCAIGGGAAGLIAVHDRKPTAAQVAVAVRIDFAQKWRRLSAGQIFPATVSYTSTFGVAQNAIRIGIAPPASCARAMDPAAARVLVKAGCITVLRATYADPSGTALATVGVAVMRSASAADSAFGTIVRGKLGALLPVSFPGTIAARFTPRARETSAEQQASGPYLLFDTAGYADGRATKAYQADMYGETVTTDLPTGLTNALAITFTAPADSCADRDIRC